MLEPLQGYVGRAWHEYCWSWEQQNIKFSCDAN